MVEDLKYRKDSLLGPADFCFFVFFSWFTSNPSPSIRRSNSASIFAIFAKLSGVSRSSTMVRHLATARITAVTLGLVGVLSRAITQEIISKTNVEDKKEQLTIECFVCFVLVGSETFLGAFETLGQVTPGALNKGLSSRAELFAQALIIVQAICTEELDSNHI